MPGLRLISAEVLKLRRRTGMLALCGGALLVTVAAYSIANAVDAPHGGLDRFGDAVGILSMLGAVIGVIVGATAGGADLETGVYRDLVATGTPRLRLMAARIPGALALVVPLLLAAIGFEALWCVALSGDDPSPTAGQLLAGVACVVAAGAFTATACVGLAAIAGSRGPVIGIALAVQLGVSPLLAQIEAIGDFRRAIPQIAIARIGDAGVLPGFTLGLAIAVLIGWLAVLLAAGARRTLTQEI
jgi:hypothetical protein